MVEICGVNVGKLIKKEINIHFLHLFFFFLMFYCKVLFSDVTAYIKLKQSLCLKDKLCKYHIYKRK